MEALLSAPARGGSVGLPAMTIVAMLLLMLPYLIKRYSGRSVTELLRFSALLDGMVRLAETLRGALHIGPKRGDAASAALSRMREADALRAAENRAAESDRSRAKHRAESARNDYLKALSELLTFARRNRLFAVVPGNLAHQGRTAELDALVVTRARVVGVLTYSFGGTIECRSGEQEDWQITDEAGTRPLDNPTRRANAQDKLVRGALLDGKLGDIPYQTVLLFTGSDAVLTGERPQGCCTREELFRLLGSGEDLNGTLLDPKETGRRVAALRAGNAPKNQATKDLGEGL